MKDQDWMKLAYEQAAKSECLRTKVGIVLVRNGELIAGGYNNVVGGVDGCLTKGCIREILHIPSGTRREVCRNICAEQLVISEAARNGVKIDGCTAYITLFPCHICAKMLTSSGIIKIYYDNGYPDEMSHQFLMEAGVTCEHVTRD